MADRKYGSETSDISCTRVKIGQRTRPDGTVEPIYDVRPRMPEAYRKLIPIVSNNGPHSGDR
jgi:hypothetical protein